MHYSKIPIHVNGLVEEMTKRALKEGLGVWQFVHKEIEGRKIDNIYYKMKIRKYTTLKSILRLADRGINVRNIMSESNFAKIKKILPHL